MLKPLMLHIYRKDLGEIKLYSPFNNNLSAILKKYIPFAPEIISNPWAWQPDITFMADFSYQYVEGLGKIVNIGHGTISKGWFFSRQKISQRENCADLICVPGTIHKQRLEQQVYKPILVSGMPKLDRCFNKSLNREEILRKWGFNMEQKVVLLAPTFNEEFSILPYLAQCDLKKIFPDFINLIVKLHGVSDDSLKKLFTGLSSENRKVHIADSYDTDEVFFVADLLISDVSSVIFEFLSLNKPILIFDSPKQKSYINYDETDLEWEYRDVGYRFDNVEKLPGLIFKVLTSNKSDQNRDIAEKFISVTDGTSTEKVIKAAFKLLDAHKEPEVTIICKENEAIKNRFGSQFPIVNQGEEGIFDSMVKVSRKVLTEYLLYLDPAFEYSPQIVKLLLNQMKTNANTGIIVPLVLDNEVHAQQFRFRVNMGQGMNFQQIGIQLSYAFTGQNRDIDYILPYCFIVRRDMLSNSYFTNIHNEKLCIHELITGAIQKDKKVLIAYDCLIQRLPEQVMPSAEQDFKYDEALQKELETVSEMSEEELQQKIYENPYNENTILKLIQYYYNNQKWEQLDTYADMLQHNIRAVYYGIKSLENQNLLEEAYQRLSRVNLNNISDKELHVNYLLVKAQLSLKLQKIDDVLGILNKAIEIDGTNIECIMTRGVFYVTQSMTTEAIQDFDTILMSYPQNVKALRGKALALQIENKFVESSACFLKILYFDAENLEAIGGLLKNSYALHDFTEIEKALDNYIDFHPANLDILFTLAGVCFEMKNLEKSKMMLDRVVIFQKDFPGARELMIKIRKAKKALDAEAEAKRKAEEEEKKKSEGNN
jgi:tetratricopeptide (TPR) repeat protein